MTLLLVLLLLSAVTLLNATPITNSSYVGAISVEHFDGSQSSGYDVTTGADGVSKFYTPNNLDPQVLVFLDGTQTFSQITVHLQNELPLGAETQLYYALPAQGLTEEQSAPGALLEDRKTLLFSIPTGAYAILRFDINASFSLDSIALDLVELEQIGTQMSIPALVLLLTCLALLALLGVLEKKLGCYAFLLQKAKGQLEKLKVLLDKGYFHFIVRIFLLLCAGLLLVSYCAFLLTARYGSDVYLYLFILSILTTVLGILDFALNHDRRHVASIILLIVMIVGFLFSFTLPRGSLISWDDEIHYERTVDLKCLLFTHERTYADLAVYKRLFPYDTISDDTSLLFLDEINLPSDSTVGNLYTYVGYLPGAIGMTIGELLDADFVKTIILTKFTQVITYALILYVALKKLKGGALIFASVGLLPSAMFLCASFSYDWWVTSLLVLGYSIFLSQLQDHEKKFSLTTSFFMLLAMILGCGPKAIYFFLILPMLFVCKDKFKSSKDCTKYRLMVLLSMLIILVSFLLPFLSNTGNTTDLRGGGDVNSTEQLKFILSNPFGYADILINFLFFYVSFGNAETFTTSYAFLGNLPNIYGTIAIFTMIYAALTDKSKQDDFKGALPLKAVSWFSVLGQLALVATALYISFTPVRAETVLGCQYRYIFPILPFALYALGSTKIARIDRWNCNEVLIPSLLAANLFATFYVVYLQVLIV